MRAAPRSGPERKRDVLAKLSEPNADVWVATSSPDGVAHLVPLSLAWHAERVVIAIETDSTTARNLAASGRARLALGPTRDVVMIDADVDTTVSVAETPADVAEAYATQSDWDPRDEPQGYVYVALAPRRILAWREANEIKGRTVMRDGAWLY